LREADGYTLADAKLARDAVRASTQIAQMGSQWLSCPYQQRVRDTIRSGKLGKIVSVSQSWNYNGPRWHVPKDENVAAIRARDTDWTRWLLGRSDRAFDPRVYFEFRIYKDFSGGITDQWYSHGAGLAHFYLDTFVPDDTIANGGIFAWHDVRENTDHPGHRALDVQLLRADQRDVDDAELAGRRGREVAVQIGGRREPDADQVVRGERVPLQDGGEQLADLLVHVAGLVPFQLDGSPDRSYRHGCAPR